MKRPVIASLLVLGLIGGSVVASAADKRSPAPAELAYGTDRLQKVDVWPGTVRGAPLVVFVHGGGWKRGDKSMMKGSAKLSHWQGLGYAVASVNYRLVPDATVEQQAQDVADAVALLKRDAKRLGYDAERLVLVGHSAGAHLVALVGTDPTYLRKAGLSYRDIDGVLPLDGAAYDVPAQMDENARLMGETYKQAFGTDPERQKALSPTVHSAAPNAPDFLILHVQRRDGTEQSRQLGAALRKAGTSAKVQGFDGRGLKGHAEINRRLGEADYPATPVVDAWLAARFAN
ncbi:alpha/beta hydrolase [Qipengyuania soli]|uniref:Alpha/beta hydrolase n=1 Tax=Qipengyuania soli TaxID=2782568 RepID=A0A7S8F5F6_9SPHN|nr:alpha/beta hydrolase [Qipengyuania soli]QPC99445.1 alpha/beta hydrolase [Qipengyuania soli]